MLEHKSGNISKTRTDRGEVTMGAYRNSPTLFPAAPSPTTYSLHFPKIGVCTPPKTPIAIISGTGKATNFTFGHNNNRVHPIKRPWKILEKKYRGRIQGLHNFWVPSIISGTGKATDFKFSQYICEVFNRKSWIYGSDPYNP